MRKLSSILILVLALALPACKAPGAIKEADELASKLELKYQENIDELVLEVLKAYSVEARSSIAFRAKVARRSGAPEEQVLKFEKEMSSLVDGELKKAAEKYKEIRRDWAKSVKLRAKVSEYLENRASAESLLRAIGEIK